MTALDLGLEGLLEGAVILWLPARFLVTLATQGLRRKLMVFPRIALAIAAAAAVVAGVIVAAAFSAPLWRALAVASVLALLLEGWRARTAFGRSGGLPPGSLALAPLGPWTDPEFYRGESLRHGAIFKMSHLVSPQVCIVDLEKGREFLRRHDAALAVPPLPLDKFVPQGFVRYMKPEPHKARSASLRTAFSRDVVAAGEPVVRRLLREALAELAADPSRAPRACLAPRVLQASTHLFFGFEPGSPESGRFERLVARLEPKRAFWMPPFRTRRTVARALEQLDAQPRGGFLAALAAVDEDAARDPAVLVNMLYILNMAAWADVSGLLTWLTKWLAEYPEWLERLRDAPEPDALAEGVVRETLRLSQSEYLVRQTREAVEFENLRVPKGWLVRVCIRDIHRRSEIFPEPEAFRPQRFATPPGPGAYAAFGASRIACSGEHMAMLYGRALVLELARGYDVAKAADGPVELGPFHWQPSQRFRVRLAPRTPA